MYKRALVYLLLITSCHTLYAQLGEMKNNWAVGVNGGVAMNKVSFTPAIKQKSYNTPTLGLTVRYISEKYFSMICGTQLELNFTQRGWQEDDTERAYSYSRKMNYLEIPFLFHAAFGKEKRGAQFFINAGPEINLLLSEKEVQKGDWTDVSGEQYGKLVDNRFDYGIIAGAGFEIKTGVGNFLLEGRYYYGLSDFYESGGSNYFDRSGHTTMSIKATFLFDLSQ